MSAAVEIPTDVLETARKAAAKVWDIEGEGYLAAEFLSGMRDESGSIQTAAVAVLADRQRDQWQNFSTAPKTGRFLVIAAGHTERPHFDDPACIVTINAPEGPMTCEGFESETGYIDEFGEQYGPDGRVDDAEDLTAENDILRLVLWMPLPAGPKAEG